METAYSSELLSTDWANPAGIDSPREHILFIAFIRSFIHYERADSIRRPLSQHNKNIIVVTGKAINIE